jgi:hypothetical protein
VCARARADGARWPAARDAAAAHACVRADRTGRAAGIGIGAGAIDGDAGARREHREAAATVAPPSTPAPQPAPAVEAPRELRAASSPTDAESERKINDLTRRANQALNGVYYQGLSPQRKEQYESVKQFLTGADQALKERNFTYAETLADKAAKLATELLGTQR